MKHLYYTPMIVLDDPNNRYAQAEFDPKHFSSNELMSRMLQIPAQKLLKISIFANERKTIGVTTKELMDEFKLTHPQAVRTLSYMELVKREKAARETPYYEKSPIDDPAVAASYVSQELMWQSNERFMVICLDIKHHILSKKVISEGNQSACLAHPRDIFGWAVKLGASRIIVAHNHPSGSLEPSSEDITLTEQLLNGAEVLGIPMLDHLILGNGDFVSLRQTTALWANKAV